MRVDDGTSDEILQVMKISHVKVYFAELYRKSSIDFAEMSARRAISLPGSVEFQNFYLTSLALQEYDQFD